MKLKGRVFGAALALLLVFLALPLRPVAAAGSRIYAFVETNSANNATNALAAHWYTALTVQNLVTSGPAMITMTFYPGGGAAPIVFTPASKLAAGAGASYNLANIPGVAAGFKGAVMLTADLPISVTVVKFTPNGIAGRNLRLISNGFASDDASSTFLIPSMLNSAFNTVTEIGIINTESDTAEATVSFYATGALTPALTKQYTIRTNEAQYIRADTVGLPTGFNGSATVTVVNTITLSAGKAVASSSEYNTNSPLGSSVEAPRNATNTVFMPTALCNLSGPSTATSAYAIQNGDTTNAEVTVRFISRAGQIVAAGPYTIAPGGKRTVNACIDGGLPNNFNGSAVITSTGGKIVAIGKVFNEGLSTAFLGATAGAEKIALPYIRYGSDTDFAAGTRQRTFIAIQNIGASAVDVDVSYRDNTGTEVKKVTLSVPGNGGKVNTNPQLAGALDAQGSFGEKNGVFGGSVLITGPSGSQLVAIVRVHSGVGSNATGEDYSGIPVQ